MIKIQFSDIPVVYEDDFLVVINKPHGILVVEDRYDKNLPTLKSILKEKYGEIFVTHRLDFGTSGVMIFAKDTFVHKRINEQFEKGEVEKEYLALVKGTGFLPVTVMLPISKRNSKGRYKINFKSGRKAITTFLPIKEFKNTTLVKAIPLTGRTHQIRVHLKSIKFPLAKDFLYGEKSEDKRLTLMCSKMSFMHPKTEENLTFELNLSDFLSQAIS
ncbi:RluA family pseudouridine synthase [Deferribacterales bacterium Es71-Z0220]|uniref:RluA family pseudouridine synthase n=1 Tax=Deferrivibrio essentukiensis TaxID=2880922 RepID=UPI001F61FFA5|nr:RluA family pseudouridine synthase [Deferrivibrio essentukiensis]MCB4204079.1 RluA family pseudouridine synthase [Deferrivibrio essentukiensis]